MKLTEFFCLSRQQAMRNVSYEGPLGSGRLHALGEGQQIRVMGNGCSNSKVTKAEVVLPPDVVEHLALFDLMNHKLNTIPDYKNSPEYEADCAEWDRLQSIDEARTEKILRDNSELIHRVDAIFKSYGLD